MPNLPHLNLPVPTPTVSARRFTDFYIFAKTHFRYSSMGHPPTNGPYLEVNLQHKPRGSKGFAFFYYPLIHISIGLWQNIDPGQRIRVTKLKGKRLKLEIKIHGISPNEISSAFRLDKLQVHLLQYENDETPSICSDGFTIEVYPIPIFSFSNSIRV